MKIDRARFLFLTSTLSASATAAVVACTVNNANTTTVVPDGGLPDTGTIGVGDSGGGDGSSDFDAGDAGDAGDAAPACLGDQGTLPICDPEFEDAGGSDAGPAKCVLQCENDNDWFKPGVAAAIKSCLDLAPTTEGACGAAAPDCAAAAVAKACADTTVPAYCTTIVGCGQDAGSGDAGATIYAECLKFAGALTTSGRTTLSDCLSSPVGEGLPDACDETSGVWSNCLDTLKQGGSLL